jgi:hypothetical protein
MYQPILLGGAVLNCYNPIAHEAVISREFLGRSELMSEDHKALRPGLLPFVDPDDGAPSEQCKKGSYFTQNQIVLDASCQSGTCFNVNGLNIYRATPLALNSTAGKYCFEAKAAP